jgi:allantoinase
MNSRYPYTPIRGRSLQAWPGGKKLAFYIALNIESYSIEGGMMEELLPASPPPDVLNYSWCDYGNRVGVWRLLELFDELSWPVTLLINSQVYDHTPQIVAAFRERGDEIACHGRTNAERQSGLTNEEERTLIREATARLTAMEGMQPRGWLSPWITETWSTPDLLKEAGYKYLLDWACDDQPVWMRTAAGPLLSVPYPQELNDSSTIIGRRLAMSDFADMIVDQFDEMCEQAKSGPLVMSLALHPHVTGQPFRVRQLRRAFRHIADSSSDLWFTRAGGIADYFAQHHPAPETSA